ncbi:hypothetical protein ES708_12017 [subsurface metagenome]
MLYTIVKRLGLLFICVCLCSFESIPENVALILRGKYVKKETATSRSMEAEVAVIIVQLVRCKVYPTIL